MTPNRLQWIMRQIPQSDLQAMREGLAKLDYKPTNIWGIMALAEEYSWAEVMHRKLRDYRATGNDDVQHIVNFLMTVTESSMQPATSG